MHALFCGEGSKGGFLKGPVWVLSGDSGGPFLSFKYAGTSELLWWGIEMLGIPRVAVDPLKCPRCPCSKLTVLRNTFSAGSLECSCCVSCRLSSGWEPETGGCELPTLFLLKGTGTCGTSRWLYAHTLSRNQRLNRKIPDFPVLRLWVDKSPGVPLFWFCPQRHQLEVFLCYCAMIKLL